VSGLEATSLLNLPRLAEAGEWAIQLRGWPALALAYASVQAPMLAGLWRAHGPLRRWISSPLLAVPLAACSAAGMSAAAVFLPGIAGGSLLPLSLGAGFSACAGYATGLHWARRRPSIDVHHRGAIIEEGISPHGRKSVGAAVAGIHRYVTQDRPLEHLEGDVRMAPSCRGPQVRWHRRQHQHLSLAGIPLSEADETKHFKLIGTTGTGKSTAICELLQGAIERGDRAVIADPDGGYFERFHDRARGDIILNPFQPDSQKWDLFGEIQSSYDIDQLARSLIPDHDGADRSWRGYARTFFCAVTRQLHSSNVGDVAELYRLLVAAETSELRTLVAGTPAQPFLEEHNGRMFDSIRSVTSSAVSALEHVAVQRAPLFSVRQWVAQGVARGATPGLLFIPYQAGQIAALRSTVSAWMRLAIFEAMNQREGNQRLWFIVDELDALGQIDGLKDALARLRKFGGRCVLGFQSIAQVSSTYGTGEAQTIVENCGNTLILRCSGSEHGGTAHFASRLIGQREVSRASVSRTRRFTQWTGSTTRASHRVTEPAVMDSQIEQLADLEGYLKCASRPQWLHARLSLPQMHARARPSAGSGMPGSRISMGAVQIRRRAADIWRRWRDVRSPDLAGQRLAVAQRAGETMSVLQDAMARSRSADAASVGGSVSTEQAAMPPGGIERE